MINLQCINLSAAGGSGSGGGGQVATPNATIFGTPVINGSQVSGFTANDYLQMPRVIDFAGKQWQLDFQFTTGEDVTTQQNIVDSGFGLAIAVSQGKMLVALSSNGTSWDLGAHAGTHAVAANTGYFVRMTFDGSKYIVSICTDGKTYETDITVTATASLFPRVILIGKSTDSRYIFGGIINLAEATLYIDGKEEWTGMTGSNYVTKTEVKQLASELTELDQKVGDLAQLETTAKDNLVNAINEAAKGGGGEYDWDKYQEKIEQLGAAFCSSPLPVWMDVDGNIRIEAFQSKDIRVKEVYHANGANDTFLSMKNIERVAARHFNLGNKTTATNMFYGCEKLEYIDASMFVFSAITDTYSITSFFRGCQSLKRIKGIEGWNTSRLKWFGDVFTNCRSIETLDLHKWDDSKNETLYSMFQNCYSLKYLDISGFGGDSLKDMRGTFKSCRELETIDLSNLKCDKLTNPLTNTFDDCYKLNSLIGGRESLDESVMTGLKYSPDFRQTNLDRYSIRAVINGLADMSGEATTTIYLGNTLKARLTSEDIAIATSKNWTIA